MNILLISFHFYLKLRLRVGNRLWRTGLELYMSEDAIDQLDILALIGHEVTSLWMCGGNHILMSQQGVMVTRVTGGRRVVLQ